jgi:polyisoprenoid-binding protein YceI
MTTTNTLTAGTWTIDATRSRAGFAARGLGHTVTGTIPLAAATVEIGADGHPTRFVARLDPAGITTGNPRRDRDLRGKRFLKTDAHPQMEVTADRIERTADGWRADATLRVAGAEAPLRVEGTLADDVPVRVTGTARLDLRTVGITVPGFMVGRWVDITVSAALGGR